MKDLLIADLHLHAGGRHLVDAFAALIAYVEGRIDRLFILGDLFEYWIGDDAVDEVGREVADHLSGLTASGCPVYFMVGNRDFLVGYDYCQQSGMRLLSDPAMVWMGGQPTLLTHGDALCTDDIDYQRARQMLRDPAWQQEFLSKSVDERLAFARQAREQSEQHVTSAAPEIMDVNRAATDQLFEHKSAARIVHGHTHRPNRHRHDGGERIVLPDWRDDACGLIADDEGMRFFVGTQLEPADDTQFSG